MELKLNKIFFQLFAVFLVSVAAGPLTASAQQLGCEEMPFNGFFQKTCRQLLTETVELILKYEADQEVLEERLAARCKANKKLNSTQKSRCKTIRRKIRSIKMFTIPLYQDTLLTNQMRTCSCPEVTDPFLMR